METRMLLEAAICAVIGVQRRAHLELITRIAKAITLQRNEEWCQIFEEALQDGLKSGLPAPPS
ncbi:MAG: hypothetical protein WCW36_03710 [Candidatus Paceibacterota bacterium]|jgi:hypothetical protein